MKNKNNKRLGTRTNIIISLIIICCLFAALSIYIIVFYANNYKRLSENSYNKQERTLEKTVLRGDIVSRDDQILAYSIQNEDGSQLRVYPFNNLFSHIVGYSELDKLGVEKIANYYLINTGDSAAQRANNASNSLLNKGYTVVTSIDVELQKIADDYLGTQKGAVIMTDVRTGEILALVSHPNFDPNSIGDLWDLYVEDDENSSLLNRVTQGKYPPGSTFKIFSSLEYYREKDRDLYNYNYDCNGCYVYDGYKISCYGGMSHGLLDFNSSFANSCNSSYTNIGMSLNRTEFSDTLYDLLFNNELPCDFAYNKSFALVDNSISDYLMMQTSIGQGSTSVSPYHLNLVTMAIANGGSLMKPFVITGIRNTNGYYVKTYSPDEYSRLMTKDEALFLTDIMKSVVEDGTGKRLKSEKYSAAGKTGSAEYDNNGNSHAWFTGFAPVDAPEVAVTIIIEGAGSGGQKAVPLAKELFDYYFDNQD